MSDHPLIAEVPLGFPWQTLDPFLFCVHHVDHYPAGDERMAPAASLAGRNLGQDFANKDGWNMYHGTVVPGFPRHPHRGFETVTVARRGYIDHSDSLGATARFGQGDVQWMTAGRGVEHCEMFPLVRRDEPNPAELFQIWLNLPARSKHVDPHFAMLWSETIPRIVLRDDQGRHISLTIAAGSFAEQAAPAPPPSSWAADPDHDVAIWTLRLEAGATFRLPPARPTSHRVLYFFAGTTLRVEGVEVTVRRALQLRADASVELVAGDGEAELLLLQGRPIGEPVAQHGPFVMNRPAEIEQAFTEYRAGKFGRWPWASDAPVHGREAGRFAIHAGGRREEPPAARQTPG